MLRLARVWRKLWMLIDISYGSFLTTPVSSSNFYLNSHHSSLLKRILLKFYIPCLQTTVGTGFIWSSLNFLVPSQIQRKEQRPFALWCWFMGSRMYFFYVEPLVCYSRFEIRDWVFFEVGENDVYRYTKANFIGKENRPYFNWRFFRYFYNL